MAKYNYTDHHYDWMWECHEKGMTYGEVLKNWPFEDMFPTRDSIRRRYVNMQHYGLEVAKNNCRKVSNKKWTTEQEQDLILAYTLCRGSMEEIIQLYKECGIDKSPNAIINRVNVLQSKEALPRFEENSDMTSRYYDHTKNFLRYGLKIIGNPIGGTNTKFKVECLAFGHTSIKSGNQVSKGSSGSGCSFCSAAGSISLNVLKNLPEGKLPCVTYFIEFEDGVVKVGHARFGANQRGKAWPSFKIIKEIQTNYFHARRIESLTHNKFERIKLYEPIAGNGGTECFQPIYKQSILKYLEEEERNLPEDAKNIT